MKRFFYIVFLSAVSINVISAENPREILKRAQDILQKEPGNYAALLNSGYAKYRLKKFEKALGYFKKAYSSADDELKKSVVRYNMGNVFFLKKNLKKSLEQYRLGLRLNPSDNDLQYNYTVTKMLLQQKKRKQNQKQKQNQKKNKEKQKNRDKQKNNQNKNRQQKSGNQSKSKQKKQPQKVKPMSKDDVKRLLKTMHEREKKQMNRPQMIIRGVKKDKDW